MQTENLNLEFSIALLMDENEKLKEVSASLRRLGFMAHHYQSLDDLWVAIKLDPPDVTIVDVTKMGEGKLQFSHHPQVINKEISYIFYYQDSTAFLLNSTYGLHPMGYLNGEISVGAQLKPLLSQKNELHKVTQDQEELKKKVSRLQAHTQKLTHEKIEARHLRDSVKFVQSFISEMSQKLDQSDFLYSLATSLSQLDFISSFGFYELAAEGSKLVSPDIKTKNYHLFPSLWLSQVNEKGIEDFAIELATQVVEDLWVDKNHLILIESSEKKPDILVFLTFNEEKKDVTDSLFLGLFSDYLSSLYSRWKLRHEKSIDESRFLPPWQSLDQIDKFSRQSDSNSIRVINISFYPLIQLIKKKSLNKFFWSSFYREFLAKLLDQLDEQVQLSSQGAWSLVLFIPQKSFEADVTFLNHFLKKFPYWKFFEDTTEIIGRNIFPKLSIVPPSSTQFFKLMTKDFHESLSGETVTGQEIPKGENSFVRGENYSRC